MRVLHVDFDSDETSSSGSYFSSRGSTPATSPLEDMLSSNTHTSSVLGTSGRPTESFVSGPLPSHKHSMQPDSIFAALNTRPVPAAPPPTPSTDVEAYMLAQAEMQKNMLLQLLTAKQTAARPSGVSLPGNLNLQPTLHTFVINETSHTARRLLHREGLRRIRVEQACERCRRRKVKCSGERPACTRCDQRGMDCQYSPGKDNTRSLRGVERASLTQFTVTSSQAQLATLLQLQAAQNSIVDPSTVLAAQLLSNASLAALQPASMFNSPPHMQPQLPPTAQEPQPKIHGRSIAIADLLNPVSPSPMTSHDIHTPSMHFPGGPNDTVPQGSLYFETSPFRTTATAFTSLAELNRSTSPYSLPPSPAGSSPPTWSAELPSPSRSPSCSASRLSSPFSDSCSSIGDHQAVGLDESSEDVPLGASWMETKNTGAENDEGSSLEMDGKSRPTSEFDGSFDFNPPATSSAANLSATTSSSSSSSIALASLMNIDTPSSPCDEAGSEKDKSLSNKSHSPESLSSEESSAGSDLDAFMDTLDDQIEERVRTSHLVPVADVPEPYVCDSLRTFLGDTPAPVIATSGSSHFYDFTGKYPHDSATVRRSQAEAVVSSTNSDASSVDRPCSPSTAALNTDLKSFKMVSPILEESGSPTPPPLCTRTSSSSTTASEPLPSTPTDSVPPADGQIPLSGKALEYLFDSLEEVSDPMEHVTDEAVF